MNLLSLDVGTTRCRASVFDPEGGCRGFASAECPVLTAADGKAEQDAEEVWRTAVATLGRALAESGAREACALSLSVQGDAVIPVDSEGRALHPAILGMDYRAAPQASRVTRTLGGLRVFRQTGMRPHPIAAVAKILWLRECRPAVYAKARRMLTYEDFLLAKLGGEPAIDVTMASRTMGFDLRRGDWADGLLRRLGIEPLLLSPINESARPVGRMSADVCRQTGLRDAPLLVTGAHDQVCAALGAGVPVTAGGVVSTGTAEVLSAAFDRPILGRALYDGHYPCYRFARKGTYFTFSMNHAGGILLSWFRDTLAGAWKREAEAAGTDPYDLILERLPAGPSPLLVLPHFNGSGTPWCDPRSRGAILGLSLSTGTGDIALAILESLAFELRINLDRLEAAGISIGDLVAVGGGARSRRWLQLKADVLGRPMRTLPTVESASTGAAILAGLGAGVYRSLEEGIGALVGRGDTVEPRAETAERYRNRYAAYRNLYPALERGQALLEAP